MDRLRVEKREDQKALHKRNLSTPKKIKEERDKRVLVFESLNADSSESKLLTPKREKANHENLGISGS